ncbi:MAG: 30S ribosomal protein S2 [Candidatus Diapherotrites archaeon]|uniref:Small ribosomal subunit protein uS2 n=1 Tax=Candidatus Iainarchaeum sp. TaxID=3101447 RepID=A0A8T3YKH3_9ARCH|nr:30S ribosomal protein S2 [Candidatus Diapherotrites archaeon]
MAKEKNEKTESEPENKTTDEKQAGESEAVVEFGAKAVQESDKSEDNEAKPTKLVETDKYLNTGSHIGTKFKSGDMKRYIYKVRKDGLNVLDVQVLDDRLKFAAKFIANFQGNKVAVVSRKSYGQTPARAFAEAIGGISLNGRFVPGTFTNPQCTRYVEPKVVMITDPEYDVQPIEEATGVRIPTVAFVSTNNALKNIDMCVPINNKGRKSLALGYWILAKEVLKERGDIKSDSEFTKTPEDFEYKMKEGEEEEQRRAFDRNRRGPGLRPRGRFGGGNFRGGGGRKPFGNGGGRFGGGSGRFQKYVHQ